MNKFAEHIKKHMGKKATVGYNAKPENELEEKAVTIGDEIMNVEWDLGEEIQNLEDILEEKPKNKRKIEERILKLKGERREAIKKVVEKYNKEFANKEIADLVYEHLQDHNAHKANSIVLNILNGKQATKRAKVTKKAFTYKDEQAALAKFLNIKEEDLTKNEDNFYFGLPEFTTKNGEEYRISASESVIRGAVAESLENLFNELGLDEFKEKVLPYVGDMERYFSVSESKFYDQAYEELQNVDDIEEPTEEQVEKKQQEIIDSYGSAEEFFIEFGDEYVKEMINYGDASFDFEKMAEDVIDEYGAGHELSSYDNSTEEVEYNGKTYYIFRQAKKTKKMTKEAGIDQRLSYGHFIKEEDENKLPKFNTLEDIKKYIKSTNRFPDNFFYKGGLFTEDEYDLDGMYVTYGSPEIDKAIVINTPDNRYNYKGDYKNLDIEIKEEDSPDFRTDINYTLPIKVYEKYFPKKQSSKTNKLANIIRKEINKSAGSIDYEVMMDIPKEKIESTKDLVKEIGLKHHIPYTDTITFGETGTIRFTLPMEEANELIKELESKGFRMLRREKKDNRTQYEWERDQKIYD